MMEVIVPDGQESLRGKIAFMLLMVGEVILKGSNTRKVYDAKIST
jgi:hypothetical protein